MSRKVCSEDILNISIKMGFLMAIFRNMIFDFKSADDCDNYLLRKKDLYPTLRETGVQRLFICRLTEVSVFFFATFKNEKDAQLTIDKTNKWRELNRFDIVDSVVLDGDIEGEFDFVNLQ